MSNLGAYLIGLISFIYLFIQFLGWLISFAAPPDQDWD